MKTLKQKKLDELAKEMPSINEKGQQAVKGNYKVVITTTRSGLGSSSTLSYWGAMAYDENGNVVEGMTGVFLEPAVNEDSCTIPGSDTAIQAGTYEIKPSTYHGESGYYEVMNVPGRSGIIIHAGNTGEDTEGCLLPGESGSYNPATNEYTVSNSRKTLNSLTDFLDKYGSGGITITINN